MDDSDLVKQMHKEKEAALVTTVRVDNISLPHPENHQHEKHIELIKHVSALTAENNELVTTLSHAKAELAHVQQNRSNLALQLGRQHQEG